MAGTTTVGDVSVDAPNAVTTTLHLIDASGDMFTDAITTIAAPSQANIEAWKETYQAASQASIYKVSVSREWEGDADPDNAQGLFRGTVSDGINLQFKNLATLRTITPRLVAPISAVMQGNQDIPLVSSTELAALIVEYLVMLGAGYSLNSAQFTGRRERRNNPRIKV